MQLDSLKGMHNRHAKLTDDDVYAIRALADAGVGPVEIVRRLSLPIRPYQAGLIGRRHAWSHLPEKGTADA